QRAGMSLVVVVARRAILEELSAEARETDHGVDPLLLRLLGHLDRAHAALDGLAHDVGEVLALLVQHVRVVHREARLLRPHDEAVGTPAAGRAVCGAAAVLPARGGGGPAPPVDLVAGAPRVRRAALEPGCKAQAGGRVLAARHDDASLRDALDAAS